MDRVTRRWSQISVTGSWRVHSNISMQLTNGAAKDYDRNNHSNNINNNNINNNNHNSNNIEKKQLP